MRHEERDCYGSGRSGHGGPCDNRFGCRADPGRESSGCNDFISEGGKIWPRIKAVAEANDCVSNMLKVLNAARAVKLRVFYAMHHRYRAGDYETWTYIAPIQRATWQHKSFEYGTWGGEFRAEFVPAPGEIVAQEHWCSSGFANTWPTS